MKKQYIQSMRLLAYGIVIMIAIAVVGGTYGEPDKVEYPAYHGTK